MYSVEKGLGRDGIRISSPDSMTTVPDKQVKGALDIDTCAPDRG